MLFIQSLPPTALPTADYKIIAAERYESFAGELGDRVNEYLTLSKDGQTINVELGHAHTVFGNVLKFNKGETIRVVGKVTNGGLIARQQIIKL